MRLLALFLLCLASFGAEYFIAPNGAAAASGTTTDPWSLSRICTGQANPSPNQPGDTIWRHCGERATTAPLSCKFVWTVSQRIALSEFTGEHPIIVANLFTNDWVAAFDNCQYFDPWGEW